MNHQKPLGIYVLEIDDILVQKHMLLLLLPLQSKLKNDLGHFQRSNHHRGLQRLHQQHHLSPELLV